MGKCSRHSSLSNQLRAIAAASPVDLARLWCTELGIPAPRLPPDLLARALAHEVQTRVLGGLPAKVAKQLQAPVVSSEAPKTPTPKAADALSAGSTLVRSWGGNTYTVVVNNDGYLLDGRRYGSLSQIATEITGTRWSGPRFFGLKAAGASSNA